MNQQPTMMSAPIPARISAANMHRPAGQAPASLTPAGLKIVGTVTAAQRPVLSLEALEFVVMLERLFGDRRRALMDARASMQRRLDEGELPDFRADTRPIREGDWRVAEAPQELQDRRVEITGPTDRKMMINALNSGASVFMADMEDSLSPTWENILDGQVNLYDFARGQLAYDDPRSGKEYSLDEDIAVIMVRPRGLHLEESNLLVDGRPVSAALFDFGLHIFNNAKMMVGGRSGPYLYLPKLESREEARFWEAVLTYTERQVGLAPGTVKITVLIETLPAAFQMDEILYALRTRIVGLNCGRWDYIFSFIKRLRAKPEFALPDRGQVIMGKAFLRAYSLLLIKTCHKRGAHAMGGMAAQIPVKGDEVANEIAFAKVRADKEREANDGHDGTWVAHPALVPVAMEVFDRLMPGPNQIADQPRDDVEISRDDLLEVHEGTRTEAGLRENIRVGVQYIEAWLSGRGAVPLYNLMEDAATAEISRAQIWQWIVHGAELDDGRTVTREMVIALIAEEMSALGERLGEERFATGRFDEAGELFMEVATFGEFEEFLTIPAYGRLEATPHAQAAE